ncbi:MAG: tRNA 2-thiouridine(34) synthase MnmA [Holophagales bacterium]|nr:tRNA 2-thiouridine(34) synthase MnmA [Holophagales bacterium]
MTKFSKGRTAIALSGGVDSSTAGALLLEEGREVVGITLQLHGASTEGLEQAETAARHLGIQHFVLNLTDDFEKLVLRPAWKEYILGRTPCPCMRCNERIKFGILMDWALENGCSALATGHYAIVASEGGQARLLRGRDKNKDQSYFLAGLSQERLSHSVFPLGSLEKRQVRKKAAELGLPCAERKESQDICFVMPGMSFPETLQAHFGDISVQSKGFIIDWEGRQLAQHEGIHNFTIGQRRGVRVGTGTRAWVCRLDAATGSVYLTNAEEDLLCEEITVSDLSWTTSEPPAMPMECEVQVRYRSVPTAASLTNFSDGCGRLDFRQPVRSAAPGQAAVFYNGDMVIGRGYIHQTFR